MNNLDFVGLFVCLAGFILGLGAVTVIDIQGFLGRTSSYWTETAIRTHKVTKPLIWVGIVLALLGGALFYRNESLSGIPLYHLIIACMLLANGSFLSLYISPILIRRENEGRQRELLPRRIQNKILLSLIVSDLGWWGGLFLLVFYIVSQ